MTLSERIAKFRAVSDAREWFDARTSREQVLVSALVIVGVCASLVMAIWRPLMAQKDVAISEIARYDDLLARVRLAGPTALTTATSTIGGEEANAPTIASSAASHGLLIRRIEPDGENTRVELENVDFAHVLDWIASMESNSIARVASIQMDRRPELGAVNVQVTLED